MDFIGTFNHQLDDKNRIRIPAKFRSEMADGYVITRGNGGCLDVYPTAKFEQLKQKFKTVPQSNLVAQAVVKKITSSVQIPEEDKQGRFVLRNDLRALAGINKNVVFIGVLDRVEIWDEDKWNSFMSDETNQSFDEAYQSLEQFGI